MKIKTIRRCLHTAATLLVLICLNAKAQDSGQANHQRRKVYNYNSTVQWSQSPFDSSVLNDDEAPSLTKDLQDFDTETSSIELQNDMIYPTEMRHNPLQSRSRAKTKEKENDLLSEPIEDVESIINDSAETTEESGWGWLADDLLKEQNKQNIFEGYSDDNAFSLTDKKDDKDETDQNEYQSAHTTKPTEYKSTRYETPLRKNDKYTSGNSKTKQNRDSLSSPDNTLNSNEEDNDVFSQWEKDLGLNKPITERSDGGLRSSQDITREITQKMLYNSPQANSQNQDYSPTTRRDLTKGQQRDRYRTDSRMNKSTQGSENPFGSRLNTPRETPSSLSRARISTKLEERAINPDSSFSTFKPTANSTTPGLFNAQQQQSSSFDLENQSKTSDLDTFRKLHKSDGIYRPFGGSSSSWAD